MSPFRAIIQWITPPETKPIVSELFSQAQQIREAKSNLRKVRGDLDSSWTGGAKNEFIAQLDSLINEYGRYASSLENKAGEVARITVWIEVKEWFDDIIPG
jgi:uncharacterized protein YukE